MSRRDRTFNLAAVFVLPVLLLVLAPLAWMHGWLGPADLVAFAVMYTLAGFGVTLGFHRMLTHRAFQTHKWLEYALAVAGSLSIQGPVIAWVADHRKHHAFTDRDGDPHSPHGHGDGLRGSLRGLWHAHAGWLFENHGTASFRRFAPDLLEDPGMRRINRAFPYLALATFALPAAIGLALTGTVHGALTAMLWGGLVRLVVLHHITWSVNSVCHFLGQRRFETEDESRNVLWLALPSLGEAWHHNHHAFARSAYHGLRWYELDPTGYAISLLQRLGLAWNVVQITPERQRERLAPEAPERLAA
jgi:stearoyl-CoA desaturase (Delta-9 desaturase)